MNKDKLEKLLEQGHITQEEFNELLSRSATKSNGLGFKVLQTSLVVLIFIGIISLIGASAPYPLYIMLVIGILLFFFVQNETYIKLDTLVRSTTLFLSLALILLSSIILIIEHAHNPFMALGALGFAIIGITKYFSDRIKIKFITDVLLLLGACLGSIIFLKNSNVFAFTTSELLYVMLVYFAAMGYIVNSVFLTVISALTVLPLIGSMGGYLGDGLYVMAIQRPIFSTIISSAIAIGCYAISIRCSVDRLQRMSRIYARVMVISANISLWTGSIFGSEGWTKSVDSLDDQILSSTQMSIIWAVLLIATLIWGEAKKIRWLVVTSTSFLVLHFYTKLFEITDMNGIGLVLSGIAGLVVLKVFITISAKKHYQ